MRCKQTLFSSISGTRRIQFRSKKMGRREKTLHVFTNIADVEIQMNDLPRDQNPYKLQKPTLILLILSTTAACNCTFTVYEQSWNKLFLDKTFRNCLTADNFFHQIYDRRLSQRKKSGRGIRKSWLLFFVSPPMSVVSMFSNGGNSAISKMETLDASS